MDGVSPPLRLMNSYSNLSMKSITQLRTCPDNNFHYKLSYKESLRKSIISEPSSTRNASKVTRTFTVAWACCSPFGRTPSGFTGRLAFIQAPTFNVVAFLKKMNPPRLRVFHLPCPFKFYPGKDKTCPDINPVREKYFTVLCRNSALFC